MKFRTLLLVLVLAAAVAAGWAWQRYHAFADAPMVGVRDDTSLLVSRGDNLGKLLPKLREQGITTGDRLLWQVLARETGASGRIQVGEYALNAATTPRALLLAMRDGKVVRRNFTIVEGWNIRDLRAALGKVALLRQTLADMDDAALMEALGQKGQSPEGRFLPETYAWTRGDSDLDILKRAYAAMDKALDAAWAGRAPDLPLKNRVDALILASIIEKETGVGDERPRIAGVFVRRLRMGMRLQTDPTVIYGMGSSYAGNLRRVDLDTDTPYNTYTRDGLPPTPIAMPGEAALRAAVHPAPGDALYFVAVGDGSGRHVFTHTLGEHSAAVREYIQRNRARLQGAQTAGASPK
ncbi:MAG: endolytic transglycosylase MltG [Thermomonas sp.]|uniref:endolytic transglycosylase MltG n=1 Tax=Thermomonas sp. TaxID=1971895 RepID=UPI00262D097E|nr:endolytic transglycosylase MltG [Thermomonas sp.]MCC7096473.1 endolytic transglycosylase MltG [Thermomonas sp.]